ncbi:hypothetical protein [Emticicia sp. SJ17W-69]|uniref:hypothetical protein n=1 Tax=Emticicia sp. SJ17W-69 TaxID=3421657 RepID=UPI003EB91499
MTTQKAVGDILKNLICDNKWIIEEPINAEKVEIIKNSILQQPIFEGISLPSITDEIIIKITSSDKKSCSAAIDGLIKDIEGTSLKEDFNTLATDPNLIDEVVENIDACKEVKIQPIWETDGHFSTVYLVALQLGMEKDKAMQLAIAAEDPDTDINKKNYEFIVDDTWKNPLDQVNIHSLTGGFHGVEEMITAVDFMTTENNNIKELGEKLHRFGDTYAHTKLSSINPSQLSINPSQLKDIELLDIKDPNAEEISKVILMWKNQGGQLIKNKIEPWIRYINMCVRVYGNSFFYNPVLQERIIANENKQPMTYPQLLKYLYGQNFTPEGKFRMYGERNLLIETSEHGTVDGLWPDQIFLRPEWYLTYVQNLATLLKIKFNLKGELDLPVFKQMTDFAVKNKKSMKGIIDFEIARFNNHNYVEIPIFHTSIMHPVAAMIFRNYDYEAETKIATDLAISYAKTYYQKDICVRPKKVGKSYFIIFK